MAMAPRTDLEQEYDNLTDRQKAIVDARVEHPDCPKTHISRDYAPEIYNRDYAESETDHINEMNNSWVTQVLNGKSNEIIPEIVEYKQDIKQNQRREGEMTTTGDPFSADPNMDDDNSWQTWDERPTKQAQQQNTQQEPATDASEHAQEPIELRAHVAAQIEDETVHVVFDRQYFQSLLEGQALPPELHKQLMTEVLSELT